MSQRTWDVIVLGGGNVKKLKELPPGCRAGDNANAFLGGFRMWENPCDRHTSSMASIGAHEHHKD